MSPENLPELSSVFNCPFLENGQECARTVHDTLFSTSFTVSGECALKVEAAREDIGLLTHIVKTAQEVRKEIHTIQQNYSVCVKLYT